MPVRIFGIIMVLLTILMVPNVAFGSTTGTVESSNNNFGFLVAAFAVVWIGLFVYFFYLDRIQKDLRRDLDDLRARQSKRTARKTT
jgi:CcmD family protein